MVKDHQPLADEAGREGWTSSMDLRRLCENANLHRGARRRTERFLREFLSAGHQNDGQSRSGAIARRRRRDNYLVWVEGDFVDVLKTCWLCRPGQANPLNLRAVARELVLRRGYRGLVYAYVCWCRLS